jgi:hypothetical protein
MSKVNCTIFDTLLQIEVDLKTIITRNSASAKETRLNTLNNETQCNLMWCNPLSLIGIEMPATFLPNMVKALLEIEALGSALRPNQKRIPSRILDTKIATQQQGANICYFGYASTS